LATDDSDDTAAARYFRNSELTRRLEAFAMLDRVLDGLHRLDW
jgi:hypothetical protein